MGAILGAVLVNALKFWLSFAAPEIWPFILSALIVLVVLVFPNGLLDLSRGFAAVKARIRREGIGRLETRRAGS